MEARKKSFVLPLALIIAGIVLILNNFGLLDWYIWRGLARLWPVLIIALGLDMIIGRGSLRLVFVLLILLILAAIYIGVESDFFEERMRREHRFSQSLSGVVQADALLACHICDIQHVPRVHARDADQDSARLHVCADTCTKGTSASPWIPRLRPFRSIGGLVDRA